MKRIVMLLAALVAGATALTAQVNVYRLVEGWAKLPPGIEFGAVISIELDAEGHVWVLHRADPMILEFSSSGELLSSIGTLSFVIAHGMTIDREGNIWVTDAAKEGDKGMQVFKLNRDGKVLMTLGKAGVAAEGPDTFDGPSDVVVAENGDIFVSDGHANNATGRIVKFSKDGKFMRAWGKTGSRPGELYIPHSIAMDSKGRLFVADRGNSRIQIFDQDGTFIDQWKQFGRPSGLYIDKNDTLYVADSHSNATLNPGFKRGLRVGSARDGYVTAFVPFVERMSEDAARASGRFSIAEAEAALGSTWAELTAMGYTLADLNNNAGWEGVAADAEGNIYAAGTTTNMVLKFVRATNAN